MPETLGNPGLSPHITGMFAAVREEPQSVAIAAPVSGRRVGVTRLVLTDFRNYRTMRLDLDTAPVVLTGPNGAGKTNLLEAISFLSPGRGLRNVRLSDVDRREVGEIAGGWAVAATAETRRGAVRIGTGRDGTGVGAQPTGLPRGERRTIRIDGEPARGQTALAEHLGVLWLTPQMDRLFIEGPSARRRLLDRLVLGLDPAHATRVARYEQAMRERARLLREGPADPTWLSALEEIMATEGVAVAAARQDAIERLDAVCAAAEGAFPRARLGIAGMVEGWLSEMPALAAEDRLRAALQQHRATDRHVGGAGIGPHRSDLLVTHVEKGIPAESASTGEQKALLIAILLAQAALQRSVRGQPPILLLDEVAAHLDEQRRTALFDIVAGLESQAWITGTDTALFAPLRGSARFLAVRDGALAETE